MKYDIKDDTHGNQITIQFRAACRCPSCNCVSNVCIFHRCCSGGSAMDAFLASMLSMRSLIQPNPMHLMSNYSDQNQSQIPCNSTTEESREWSSERRNKNHAGKTVKNWKISLIFSVVVAGIFPVALSTFEMRELPHKCGSGICISFGFSNTITWYRVRVVARGFCRKHMRTSMAHLISIVVNFLSTSAHNV